MPLFPCGLPGLPASPRPFHGQSTAKPRPVPCQSPARSSPLLVTPAGPHPSSLPGGRLRGQPRPQQQRLGRLPDAHLAARHPRRRHVERLLPAAAL